MRPPFKKIVIVGVGLIGGSVGMAVRKKRLAATVVGLGPDARALKKAVSRRAIHRFEADPRKWGAALEGADLVVLAAPVGQLESAAERLAPLLSPGTIVTDVGSVKAPIVGGIEASLGPLAKFVGGHPIAGRERSGVEAASADLFAGALCILTPTGRTAPAALAAVRRLWRSLGARVVLMEAARHDRILAAVSHLPHLIAYALIGAILDLEADGGALRPYAAGGLKDFTRIAASSPGLWRDIALANRDNLIAAIEAYEKALGRIKGFLAAENGGELLREFERARAVRAAWNRGPKRKTAS